MAKTINADLVLAKLEELKSWVVANQRDETGPPPPPPPPTGQWNSQVNSAYKMNQAIKNPDGFSTSFGRGFFYNCVPGPVSISQGSKTYFLIDCSWMSTAFGTSRLIVVMQNQVVSGLKLCVYLLDASNNGSASWGPSNLTANGASISLPKRSGYKYLIEIDATLSSGSFEIGLHWS